MWNRINGHLLLRVTEIKDIDFVFGQKHTQTYRNQSIKSILHMHVCISGPFIRMDKWKNATVSDERNVKMCSCAPKMQRTTCERLGESLFFETIPQMFKVWTGCHLQCRNYSNILFGVLVLIAQDNIFGCWCCWVLCHLTRHRQVSFERRKEDKTSMRKEPRQ